MSRHRLGYSLFSAGGGQPRDERQRPITPTRELLRKTESTEMVGARIKRLRAGRGWTQGEVLANIEDPRGGHYSHGFLSRLEKGFANPPIYAYVQVAEAFELAPEGLLGGEDLQRDVGEAEMTLLRTLRRLEVSPDEALARILGDAGRG